MRELGSARLPGAVGLGRGGGATGLRLHALGRGAALGSWGGWVGGLGLHHEAAFGLAGDMESGGLENVGVTGEHLLFPRRGADAFDRFINGHVADQDAALWCRLDLVSLRDMNGFEGFAAGDESSRTEHRRHAARGRGLVS
jgi:hypothetical protein